jgi:DNA polymerase III subunit gamma/tau
MTINMERERSPVPEQALYLKWRPARFEDVVGQDHITRTLRNSLRTGRIRHAYLFSGPRGTGKTTTARLLAKAVNCTHPDAGERPCNECPHCISVNEGRFLDLIEIDAASHTGVDDVRDLRDRIAFSPGEGAYRVYIIDEVHRFSGNAFDALLKTLEEPPDHALFILATTEIDKVPATIKSRCLPFEVRRLSLQEMTDHLVHIAEHEGINAERAALELIARAGTGSARDSISLLDQVVADPSEMITLELTQRILGTANTRAVRDLIDAFVKRDASGGLQIINEAIDSGSDPHQFAQQMVEHLRAILLTQSASVELIEASQDDKQWYQRLAKEVKRGPLMRAVKAFNEATSKSSGGWQPQLALELALLESLQEPDVQQVVVAAAAPQAIPASNPFADKAPAASPSLSDAASADDTADDGTPLSLRRVQKFWPAARDLIKQFSEQSPEMKMLPDMMEHVTVRSVQGNQVALDGKPFYMKNIDQQKMRWIARALKRVMELEEEPLVVRADQGRASGGAGKAASRDPLVNVASELGATVRTISDKEDRRE